MIHTDGSTPAAAHTPEPWDYDMDYIVASDPNGQHPDIYIAEIAHSDDEGRVAPLEQQDANRRRICAAVNACAGLATESLERGIVAEQLHVLERLLTAAEELDAAIDGATDQFDDDRAELEAACRIARATLAGSELNVHELLGRRGRIAIVWSVDDVQIIRPDLTFRRAWQVLKRVQDSHNATLGVTWQTLEQAAEDLFGPDPEPAQA